MEQNFAEYKEATFQIKHISESVGIELKKMIRSLSQVDLRQREFKPLADTVCALEKSRDKLGR